MLTVTVPDEPDVTFRSGPDPDVAALSLLAVARGVDGCVELRQTLRGTAVTRSGWCWCAPRGPDRGRWPARWPGCCARTAIPRRASRCCPAGDPPAYHRAALAGSTLLWRRPEVASAGR